MAEIYELVGESRTKMGSSEARRLRRQGRIPAVVYGHKEATLSLVLDKEALERALRHHARIVDLKAGGKSEKALLREVQYDFLGKEVLHVDLERVAADERIVVPVAIQLRGHAPGATAGGVLDQPLHEIEVECPALAVPENIRVNIGELQIGGVIHVRDLVLPEGVKAQVDPDAVVVQVKAPVTAEPGAVPAAGEQAEPEIIGRRVAEEKEEGE
jgi:large subunit ribosomal protein L25